MPFVPVVGVNHHGNTTVFAAALISKEDSDSHAWVFKKYLDCMGKAPSVIITDQCKAIGKAIRDVFPGTPHRLCLWHMLRNAARNLGNHTNWHTIDVKLRKVVHDSVDADDFEIHWFALVNEYQLNDNNWIKESYAIKHSWVPVYWRDTFCAGMSSTQRSEQSNRFFKQYVNPETTLIKFISQFELALKTKVEEELKMTFQCEDKKLKYDKDILFEEVFHKVYTITKFKEVQRETYGLVHTNAEPRMNIGSFSSYEVTQSVITPWNVSVEKTYQVTVDTSTGEFLCCCKLFEFSGILCRHIMRVLSIKKVPYIPDKYILNRWRKDLVRGYENISVGYYKPEDSVRLKRSLDVTIRNDYIYRLALHDDEAYAIYEREGAKLAKALEDHVGIETIKSLGTGTETTLVWGRRRLQRRELNQRYIVRNAPPVDDGRLKDPIDKRGTGRAPKPRQKTVRKQVILDMGGSSQPSGSQPSPTNKKCRKLNGKGVSLTQ